MIIKLNTYRVRCDECDQEKIVETTRRLEGDGFFVKDWTSTKKYKRGGTARSHYCPECSKKRR